MFNSAVSMRELELETVQLLPRRETLCVMRLHAAHGCDDNYDHGCDDDDDSGCGDDYDDGCDDNYDYDDDDCDL
jgi:hypothetical protein